MTAPSPLHRATAAARRHWSDTTGAQRFLYAAGAALMASGLVHLGVFLVDGGPWSGPVSWRKPVTFGLSFGLTALTAGWILQFVPGRHGARWLVAGPLGAASAAEVGLVSLQQWRGVPSHFNDAAPFDAAVFALMGVAVAFIVAALVALTVWCLRPLTAPPSLAWAIRLGLLLLLVSQGIGGALIANGSATIGAAGAGKVPHAITLHAVQVLPALALLLRAGRLSERRRVLAVGVGALGYASLSAGAVLQAAAGRAPLALVPGTATLGAVGAALLVGAAGWALLAALHRPGRATGIGRASAGTRPRSSSTSRRAAW